MEDREFVCQIISWIEEHLSEPEINQQLPRVSGYSQNRLREKFYNVTGITPSGYLRRRRLTEAAKALESGRSIADVAVFFGYSSQDNFTTAFKACFGLTPGEVQSSQRKLKLLKGRKLAPLTHMKIKNLKQEPLSTTLLGCMKGAADYFDLDWTIPELFVLSTHAFVINVHRDLCPSSPYVWKKHGFQLALRNLGIRCSAEIRLDRKTSARDLAVTADRIRRHLDDGSLCTVDFLEHQLVSGYDSRKLHVLRPWDCNEDVELDSLTFGSWKEAIEKEGWVHFTLLDREEKVADRPVLLQQALMTALQYWNHPGDLAFPNYGTMATAWDNWISAVDRGLGSTHGHWWCDMVWSENR
jgi:AraC-like DNA-binding protein